MVRVITWNVCAMSNAANVRNDKRMCWQIEWQWECALDTLHSIDRCRYRFSISDNNHRSHAFLMRVGFVAFYRSRRANQDQGGLHHAHRGVLQAQGYRDVPPFPTYAFYALRDCERDTSYLCIAHAHGCAA